jgi:hypothetical protein
VDAAAGDAVVAVLEEKPAVAKVFDGPWADSVPPTARRPVIADPVIAIDALRAILNCSVCDKPYGTCLSGLGPRILIFVQSLS